MKRLLLIVLSTATSWVLIYAQKGNVRITDFNGYSVDPPHFIIDGNNVALTFSTNLSYLYFPIAGSLQPEPIDSVGKPTSVWGPFYAEVGQSGTDKVVVYSDYNSGVGIFNIYQSYTTDNGLTWTQAVPIQQIASGYSMPSTQFNPSVRCANNDIYVMLQSYDTANAGILSVYRLTPPNYWHIPVFQPYFPTDSIYAEDASYSVKQVGNNIYHLVSYYDNNKIYFQKSEDDGQTLSFPTVIWSGDDSNMVFQNLEGLDMDMDTQGRVAIVWSVYGETSNFQMFFKTYLAYSADFGNTFVIDTLSGIYALDATVRLKSDGQQVITYKEQGNILTVTTDRLQSFTQPITITDTATADKFNIEMFNGEYLCVAWVDQRFGWAKEEIYYDTLYVPSAITTGVSEINSTIYSSQVYPNPFSSSATLFINGFSPSENTTLEIYDISGRAIEIIVNINSSEIFISNKGWNSGLYFYLVKNDKKIISKGKMVIK